jgi:integrase
MLTDTACRKLKHQIKPYKRSDGGGLYLLVTPTGSKLWNMSYRFGGKQKKLAFGVYPLITLLAARDRRDAAKKLLANNIDPSEQKKVDQREAIKVKPTFRFVSERWFRIKVIGGKKAGPTRVREERNLKVLNAVIGDMNATEIEPPDVLRAITPAQDAEHHETANRLRLTASNVFQFGIPHGYCKRDPANDLKGAMTKVKDTPRPAIVQPVTLGTLLCDIEGYHTGRFDGVVSLSLQFLALVGARPGEVRLAKWQEFDFVQARWTIPAERMKMRKEHIVPLSRQALAILETMRGLTGKRSFVFSLSRDEPMSDNTLNKALRIMGYDTKTQHCAHGFRSSFSTILNDEYRPDGEKVWHDDVIELQLSHVDGNSVRKIYNRTGPMSLMPQRIKLMQHWADRVDIMRDGSDVLLNPKRNVA